MSLLNASHPWQNWDGEQNWKGSKSDNRVRGLKFGENSSDLPGRDRNKD